VYSRELADRVLEFGVSGKLIRNALVMYDRQTESLWSQVLGKAIRGDLKGQELTFLPSWQTTWEDWKARHPDTLALVKGYRGIRDPYTRYYDSGQAGVLGETFEDDRLSTKEFVIGVQVGSDAVAYPFRYLSEIPVVNDTVGERPVLVVFDAEHASGVVFSREVDGRVLTFEWEEALRLRDKETGSIWDGLNGRAISGELEGATLARVKSTRSFWFGWKDFYPDTRVWGLEGS
jgi:hypothetical protein